MAATNDSFAGTWHLRYWYPSNDHDGEDTSEYDVTVHQKGSKLIIESLPNPEESYMLVKLTLDNELATGSWEEHTSPSGSFGGSIYSGALQLIISDDKKRMEGKWVGVGRDHEKGQADIYTGNWDLVRSDTNLSEAPVA